VIEIAVDNFQELIVAGSIVAGDLAGDETDEHVVVVDDDWIVD